MCRRRLSGWRYIVATEFVTNEEIVRAARRRLPQDAWDYLVGGSESETTLRRNRLAFDRIAFRPRTLVDVSSVDPSATVAGHNLRIPVFLAPMGSLQTFAPEGGAASTKAAAEYGTLHVVSSVTQPGLQAIAEAVDYPKVYQLYIRGDWSWVEEQIAMIYATYQKLLTEANALDFNDLLLQTLRLFEQFPEVLGWYRRRVGWRSRDPF